MKPLLDISGISHHFGGLQALNDVSLQIGAGECVALIGPNGAGKSTLFHLIGGRHRLQTGRIHFDGQTLQALKASKIAPLGIGQAFQAPALFPSLNIMAHLQLGQRFGGGKTKKDLDSLVEMLELGPYVNKYPGELPYGWQKRAALGRALAGNPRLLLLDEPAAGLNQAEQTAWIKLMKHVLDSRKLALFFIEHQLSLVRALAQRAIALNFGQVLTEGPPDEVFQHPLVQAAYFGPQTQ